jgi:hypothetical protein
VYIVNIVVVVYYKPTVVFVVAVFIFVAVANRLDFWNNRVLFGWGSCFSCESLEETTFCLIDVSATALVFEEYGNLHIFSISVIGMCVVGLCIIRSNESK